MSVGVRVRVRVRVRVHVGVGVGVGVGTGVGVGMGVVSNSVGCSSHGISDKCTHHAEQCASAVQCSLLAHPALTQLMTIR